MHCYAAATPHPQRCVTYVPIARGVEIRDLNGQRPPAAKRSATNFSLDSEARSERASRDCAELPLAANFNYVVFTVRH